MSEWDLTKHCQGFETIAKANDVRLQLVGDSHTVSFQREPVPYRIGGSLSGCWWNTKTTLCPDLSPRGYFVYRVEGEKLEQFYKGLDRRIEITSHQVGDVWTGEVEIQAHLVQPLPDEALRYSVDGDTWHAMTVTGEPFYRRAFSAKVDSTALRDGFVNLQVRGTRDEREVRKLKVVCANGNKAPKFASGAVLRFSVGAWRDAPKTPGSAVEVWFNDQLVGTLRGARAEAYTFEIAASRLRKANVLRFRFSVNDDEMVVSQLSLRVAGTVYRDARDEAIRRVKSLHWGPKSADWGGYIVGRGRTPENTFTLRRDTFSFVLEAP